MFLHRLSNSSPARLVGLAALCCLFTCAGCTGGTPCAVSGLVTFDGQPLAEGNIKFDPAEENEGTSGSAKVTDGKYAIPLEAGMLAGKFMVSITATKATGRQVRQFDSTTALMPEIIQYIPEQYNRLSELTADLQGGENTQSFALKSKP